MSLTEISQTASPEAGSGHCLSARETAARRNLEHRSVELAKVKRERAAGDFDTQYFEFKSKFDQTVGLLLFVASSPLILILAVVVRCTSRGPAIYRQTRVGQNGQNFELLKLRSMVRDAEIDGEAVWCATNDLRVTKFGRILRKLHMDELPQLWNVAKGDMSLVGPRPERPEICENLVSEIDDYHARHKIKPGITGLAQVNLPPDQTIEDVQRKQILDLRYIQEASLGLDLRMISATALRMLGFQGEVVMKLMRLCRRDYLNEQMTAKQQSRSRVRQSSHTFESAQATDSPRRPR